MAMAATSSRARRDDGEPAGSPLVPGLPPAVTRRWELWREDDNANRYLVSVHDDEESANARLAAFESGVVHKQRYWVTAT